MTREEVIKYLEQHGFIDDEVKDMCIEALANDINVGSKWIPCSERLPKEYEDVLCWTSDGGVVIGKLYTDSIFGKLWGFINNGSWRFECIVAWQPLPEPYKEEPQNVDRCVCCGEIIPEGRQVCINCESKGDNQ